MSGTLADMTVTQPLTMKASKCLARSGFLVGVMAVLRAAHNKAQHRWGVEPSTEPPHTHTHTHAAWLILKTWDNTVLVSLLMMSLGTT